MFRRTTALLVLACVLVCGPAAAARDRDIVPVEIDRAKFRAYNIGVTAFFTLVTAVVQGEVTSPRDAVNHFLIGAGAGFSFYQASALPAEGDRPRRGFSRT